MTPGRCQFWPQGYYLNKLGRHWLDDISCQICKLELLQLFKGFLKFFLSVAMAFRVLHCTQGTILWSFDEIGLAVYEEMSFKVKVYGPTDAGQKLIMSLCDRWANKALHVFHNVDDEGRKDEWLTHQICCNLRITFSVGPKISQNKPVWYISEMIVLQL
jgi:hypothetical protein